MQENLCLCRAKKYDASLQWVTGYYVKSQYFEGRGVGFIIKENSGTIFQAYEDYDVFSQMYEVLPETLGRYIGISDKNGERVFEDDVVRTKCGRICRIVWSSTDSHQGWAVVPLERKDKPLPQCELFKSENLEVIGNIYDNPDYLNYLKGAM